jgi:prophage antirepressor-like protein
MTQPGSQQDNPLNIFNFGDLPIRVINRDGEPWFVAADVCKALEISDVKQAVGRLDDDERGRYDVPTGGGIQSSTCISEPGLYTLILTSRKDNAKDFKRWITHEVIPAIRKTGVYQAQSMTPGEILVAQAQKFLEHERALMEHERRIEAVEARIDAQNEYFTVLAFCRLKHITTPTLAAASSIGKRCSALSRERHVEIGQANDPRFGLVNTYHLDILTAVIEPLLLGGDRRT